MINRITALLLFIITILFSQEYDLNHIVEQDGNYTLLEYL